jgi:hypothetical protein
MKRTVSIVCVFLILVQSGGLFIFYKVQQACVHYEMMQVVRNYRTSCQTLIISNSEFQRCRTGSNEMFFQGLLYDIKSAVIHGNKVELLVIKDTIEMGIVKKAIASAGSSRERHNGMPIQLVKLLMLNYISFVKKYDLTQEVRQSEHFITYFNTAVTHPIDVLTPPPKSI